MSDTFRMAIVGTGLQAAEYAKSWLRMPNVSIVAAADVNSAARDRFEELCVQAGCAKPRMFANIESLLQNFSMGLDAVYLSTPHKFHAEGAIAVVDAGLDLLLEKPMAVTVDEARDLVKARKRTNSTVVVAYQGGLSPLVREVRDRAAAGEFGELLSISGTIWENWAKKYSGQWKQDPEISGGGFMFDTGAHMMNTACMLAGSEFDRVSAFTDHRSRPVEVVGVVAARLERGALVTFNAVGDVPFRCASHISLFYTKASVHVDAWGQWREVVLPDGTIDRDEKKEIDNPLPTFMAIRDGRVQNHSSAEHGLRLAMLWDAIKSSAERGGAPVSISNK